MHLEAKRHQLAHLVDGPTGAIHGLDSMQNTHHKRPWRSLLQAIKNGMLQTFFTKSN
jgi:hypothetical protein